MAAGATPLELRIMGGSLRPNSGALQLIRRAWESRWLLIVVCMWLQSVSGAAYTFGVYSGAVKASLGYDQKTLDLLGFFKDIGGNVGVLSGLLLDYLPVWVILSLGMVHNFVGYIMMWLAVTERIAHPPFWLMCLFICMASNAQTYFSTAVVVTCVKSFPSNRGMVIGLQKGLLGLSGAILTQTFHALYGKNPASFISMIAWLPSLVALLSTLRIRTLPHIVEEGEVKTFHLFFVNALVLALYLMAVILLQNTGGLKSDGSQLIVFGMMVVILLTPLGVVFKSEYGNVVHKSPDADPKLLFDNNDESSRLLLDQRDVESSATQNIVLADEQLVLAENTGLQDEENERPGAGDDHTFLQAVSGWNFWLLFLAMSCAMGSGLTAIDNLGQIGASLGYKQPKIDAFISLVSIWNFLGRAGAGFISEHYLRNKGTARPLFLVLSLAAMSLGHLVIASGMPGCLYVGSTVVGLCYGAQWSLMPATTSEIFGLPHFGLLFNTIAIASPLGAYFLSVRVAGYLYDIEAEEQHRGLGSIHSTIDRIHDISTPFSGRVLLMEGLSCDGPKCFRMSFTIMAAVCLLGCLASFLLVLRTRKFYKQEFLRRQLEAQAISEKSRHHHPRDE